jgi:hypothetical protein
MIASYGGVLAQFNPILLTPHDAVTKRQKHNSLNPYESHHTPLYLKMALAYMEFT